MIFDIALHSYLFCDMQYMNQEKYKNSSTIHTAI